jgi:hypothetical protein
MLVEVGRVEERFVKGRLVSSENVVLVLLAVGFWVLAIKAGAVKSSWGSCHQGWCRRGAFKGWCGFLT